jgi:hypothetical protein
VSMIKMVENWPLEQEGKVSWNIWVTVPRGTKGTYEVACEVILAKTQKPKFIANSKPVGAIRGRESC